MKKLRVKLRSQCLNLRQNGRGQLCRFAGDWYLVGPFLRGNEDDGNRAFSDQLLRDTAEQPALGSAEAAAGHDDHVVRLDRLRDG